MNQSTAFPEHKTKNIPSIHYSKLKEAIHAVTQEIIRKAISIEYCKNYFYVLQVAFYTLCRAHEYTNIEWEWIDFEKKTITIPAEYMKKGREHLVPITTQLERGLKKISPDRTKLFVVGRNQTPTSVRQRLSKILAKRELPVPD